MKMNKRRNFDTLIITTDKLVSVEGSKFPMYIAKPEDFVGMSENHVSRCELFRYQVPAIYTTGSKKGEFIFDEEGNQVMTERTHQIVVKNTLTRREMKKNSAPEDANEYGLRVAIPLNDGQYNGTIVAYDADTDRAKDALGGTYQWVNYVRSNRSPSQQRTAAWKMIPWNMYDQLRTYASHGWVNLIKKLGEKVSLKEIAKIESYIPLSETSSLDGGIGFTYVDIKDYSLELDATNVITSEQTTENGKVMDTVINVKEAGLPTIESTPTDGQAKGRARAFAKIAKNIGIISVREYQKLECAFMLGMTYKEQAVDPVLKDIWTKIPSAFQYRWYLRKGLMYMDEHGRTNAQGEVVDFVFPEGAIKDQGITPEVLGIDPATIHYCVANVAHTSEKKWGTLNYQFIQAMNIPFEGGLDALAVKWMQQCEVAMESPENAIAWLGMVSSSDEEEQGNEDTTISKLRELLTASPLLLSHSWVEGQFKKLMRTSIANMRRGRIPVEDASYVFIIADPTALEQDVLDGKREPLLKKGQFYFNGKMGTRSIFRSPCIHKSEPVVIELVNSPELEARYGHLKNVLILNAFDDTLARLGGADTDGDKVYLTGEQIIINSVEQGQPLVTGDIADKLASLSMTKEQKAKLNELSKKYEWGRGAIAAADKQTLTPSAVGIVTDYCTALADMARGGMNPNISEAESEMYWNFVVTGRVKQGNIIDDAKKGTSTSYQTLTDLVKIYPNWLRDTFETHNKNGDQVCYISQSPMGHLFAWTVNVALDWFDNHFTKATYSNYRTNILVHCDNYDAGAMNAILEDVAALEHNYRLDIQGFFSRPENSNEKGEYETETAFKARLEDRNKRFQELLDQHTKLLASINAPAATIGAACLHVAENGERRSEHKTNSYPFIIATPYVCALVSGMNGNFKLVRIQNVDPSAWNGETTVKVEFNVIQNEEGEFMGGAKVRDGEYDVHEYDGKLYLRVPVMAKNVEIEAQETNLVSFQVTGFRKFGINSKQVAQAIAQQSIVVNKESDAEGDWLAVGFQGQRVGFVHRESIFQVSRYANKELNVVRVEEIRGLLVVTATVTGDSTVVLEKVQQEAPAAGMSYDEIDYSAMDMGSDDYIA